ncbi:MAG TPA: radical SAM protein, partial [Pseudomonadota bacterium]|nr:radical SAM protein [Pseudomonadota bacterium]
MRDGSSCGTTSRSGSSSLHLPIVDGKPAVRTGPGTAAGPLVDGLSRSISYLRISLTDRCNYRCTYCMPDEGIDLAPRADVLSFEEIEHAVEALMRVGVRKVRLTGGEPTVRKDLIDLVQRLSRLGLDDLSLSTNGERLVELAAPLKDAGLHRLNVSVDTLREDRFLQVTRRGNLAQVLAGLDKARAVGFVHTKVNCVAMRGFNDDEFAAL